MITVIKFGMRVILTGIVTRRKKANVEVNKLHHNQWYNVNSMSS
jgi:hypothetical protein